MWLSSGVSSLITPALQRQQRVWQGWNWQGKELDLRSEIKERVQLTPDQLLAAHQR